MRALFLLFVACALLASCEKAEDEPAPHIITPRSCSMLDYVMFDVSKSIHNNKAIAWNHSAHFDLFTAKTDTMLRFSCSLNYPKITDCSTPELVITTNDYIQKSLPMFKIKGEQNFADSIYLKAGTVLKILSKGINYNDLIVGSIHLN